MREQGDVRREPEAPDFLGRKQGQLGELFRRRITIDVGVADKDLSAADDHVPFTGFDCWLCYSRLCSSSVMKSNRARISFSSECKSGGMMRVIADNFVCFVTEDTGRTG